MSQLNHIIPLFHKIYSVYFKTVSRILEQLSQKKTALSAKDINQIIKTNAFPSDAKSSKEQEAALLTKLQECGILILNEDGLYESELCNIIRPQTTLEKQWLITMQNRRTFSLFADPNKLPQPWLDAKKNTQPMYTADNFTLFDKFTDGDDYTNELYKEIFRSLLQAIKEHKYVSFQYYTNNEQKSCKIDRIIPVKLEYSPKNDKFRLLAFTEEHLKLAYNSRDLKNATITQQIFNLSNFQSSCQLHEALTAEDMAKLKQVTAKFNNQPKSIAVIELVDSRNALQRALIAFSDYQKEVMQLNAVCKDDVVYARECAQLAVQGKPAPDSFKKYIIILRYLPTDEKELVIRILGMGHLVKVLSQTIKNAGLKNEEILLTAPTLLQDILKRISIQAQLHSNASSQSRTDEKTKVATKKLAEV